MFLMFLMVLFTMIAYAIAAYFTKHGTDPELKPKWSKFLFLCSSMLTFEMGMIAGMIVK